METMLSSECQPNFHSRPFLSPLNPDKSDPGSRIALSLSTDCQPKDSSLQSSLLQINFSILRLSAAELTVKGPQAASTPEISAPKTNPRPKLNILEWKEEKKSLSSKLTSCPTPSRIDAETTQAVNALSCLLSQSIAQTIT